MQISSSQAAKPHNTWRREEDSNDSLAFRLVEHGAMAIVCMQNKNHTLFQEASA
jgi:hypothetical protein